MTPMCHCNGENDSLHSTATLSLFLALSVSVYLVLSLDTYNDFSKHNSEQISGNWSIMPINKWTVCEMPEAQWREHEQHKAKAVDDREKLHSR